MFEEGPMKREMLKNNLQKGLQFLNLCVKQMTHHKPRLLDYLAGFATGWLQKRGQSSELLHLSASIFSGKGMGENM